MQGFVDTKLLFITSTIVRNVKAPVCQHDYSAPLAQWILDGGTLDDFLWLLSPTEKKRYKKWLEEVKPLIQIELEKVIPNDYR